MSQFRTVDYDPCEVSLQGHLYKERVMTVLIDTSLRTSKLLQIVNPLSHGSVRTNQFHLLNYHFKRHVFPAASPIAILDREHVELHDIFSWERGDRGSLGIKGVENCSV